MKKKSSILNYRNVLLTFFVIILGLFLGGIVFPVAEKYISSTFFEGKTNTTYDSIDGTEINGVTISSQTRVPKYVAETLVEAISNSVVEKYIPSKLLINREDDPGRNSEIFVASWMDSGALFLAMYVPDEMTQESTEATASSEDSEETKEKSPTYVRIWTFSDQRELDATTAQEAAQLYFSENVLNLADSLECEETQDAEYGNDITDCSSLVTQEDGTKVGLTIQSPNLLYGKQEVTILKTCVIPAQVSGLYFAQGCL
jgi:hypothetical protein